jgi:hypothetical protein
MNEIPVKALGDYTLVFDKARNKPILRLAGVLVLPVGSEIELVNPNVNARVVRVRLLAPAPGVPAVRCLDVEVPPT